MSAPSTPKATSTSGSQPGSAEKASSPAEYGTPTGFSSLPSPDARILKGCQRVLDQAKKLGLDLPETQAEIAAGIKYILDAGNEDVATAVNAIKLHSTQVGENTVQGVVLAGILDAFEDLGGFEELFEYSIVFLESQQKHYLSQMKVIPKLAEGDGEDFAPGSSWGAMTI